MSVIHLAVYFALLLFPVSSYAYVFFILWSNR